MSWLCPMRDAQINFAEVERSSRVKTRFFTFILKLEHFESLIVDIVCLVMVSYTNNIIQTTIYHFNKLCPYIHLH